jgi:SOS-response transcriptional repressor LexA
MIVKKGESANAGEIVVAIVDYEFTVKYLAQDKNGCFLRPGN